MPRWIRCPYPRAGDIIPGRIELTGARCLYARAGDAGIVALLAIALLAAALLAGCGQSGPLTLPNRDAGGMPVSETSPELAEETQVDTGDPESDDEQD